MSNAEQTEFEFPDEKEAKKGAIEADAEFEIEVQDDTPEADRGRKPMTEPPEDPTDEELNNYSKDAQKRIKHFTKGFHEERRAKEAALREREEAVRFAQAAFEENKRLKGSLNEGHTALLAQTKAALDAEVLQAKAMLKEAQDSFDSDKIVEAQDKLTEAKIKLSQVNNFRNTPLQQEKDEVQTPHQPVKRPAADPKALAWNQRNEWFGTDPEMTAYTMGLHQKLVGEGIDPRSDDYYQRIDARVRKLFPEKFESVEEPRANKSPVAPASRSTAPKKIVLTQSQVAIAKRLGVPLADYAKQVAMEQRNQNG